MTTNATVSSAFTLVVGNDFSAASGYAFDQAARVARRIPGSDLHVVHVMDGQATADGAKRAADQLRLYVDEKAKALGGLERQPIAIHVRSGKAARELAQLAKDVGADLLVVGTHKGPHLKQLLVGSVAERLLAASPCPVFVAGPMPAPRDDAHDPAILPPCNDCLEARRASAGGQWWCARHAEHHTKAHSYSFRRELSFRSHDSSITPTGVDMK